VHLVGLPLAASVRGIGLSLVRRQPRWVPYYLCYGVFNYLGMLEELFGGLKRRRSRKTRPEEHEREALRDEAP